MLVYFMDRSAQTVVRAATLRQKLQIKTFYLTQSQYTDTGSTSPSTDPIMGQTSGRAATGVPIFKSLVLLDPEKSPRRKQESNPRSAALEADALTTQVLQTVLGIQHHRGAGSNHLATDHLLVQQQDNLCTPDAQST